MTDFDNWIGILLVALFVFTLVIGVLGSSVLIRLARNRRGPTSGVWLLAFLGAAALLAVAFFATFLPYLAFLPGLLFLVLAFRLWAGGAGLPHESAAVVGLVALAWCLFAAYQKVLLAWSATVSGPIRFDLVLVLPAMALISFFGWSLQGARQGASLAERVRR